MARKLASDKILFAAPGRAVSLRVRDDLQRLGRLRGRDRRQPLPLPAQADRRAGRRRARGLRRLRATDYRRLAQPWVVYGAYGARAAALRRGALPAADQRRAPLARPRTRDAPAVGAAEDRARPRARVAGRGQDRQARRHRSRGDSVRRARRRSPPASCCSSPTWARPSATSCSVRGRALARRRARRASSLIGAAAALPVLAILAFSASYRNARLLSFLRPEADPLGAGFQALQSLIAVGAGGWLGNGLGGEPPEALLPAVPAHGLHLRDRRRGAGLRRGGRRSSRRSA